MDSPQSLKKIFPQQSANMDAPRPSGYPTFVCPVCKGGLRQTVTAYSCQSCARDYPILFDIPDFRLRSDRYLSLEEERDKARKLYEFGAKTSFTNLVRYYYSITDDVPKALATRYRAYIDNAPKQAEHVLNALRPNAEIDTLLDAGCGAGGLLMVAHNRYRTVIGVDIALRWLVMCQKRLEEHGIKAMLICADVESLPFPENAVSHIVAADLLEHVYDVRHTLEELRRSVKPQGKIWISASNRYCLGPHPLTRLWAIGYVPRKFRRLILLRARGVDSMRYVNLLSPHSLASQCKSLGFRLQALAPRNLVKDLSSPYPGLDRVLISIYRAALGVRFLHRLLLWFGPAFEMTIEKKLENH